MYPNLYYAFEDLFGIKIKGLQLINSFGFFVAIAFLVGAWVLTRELRRKEAKGVMDFTERTIVSGQQVSVFEVVLNFALGFFLGFKLIGAFIMTEAMDDPQAFIFSGKGHLVAGLITAALFGGLKLRERMASSSGKPEKRVVRIWPHDRVGDLVIYAAIFGFAGAKLFDILENPAGFMDSWREWRAGRSDAASFLFSGLTIYGGLIVATIAIIIYARKHKIAVLHLADAFAPTMMIGYAIGRIGCQVSGDGDWGIVNSAYISDAQANIVAATAADFPAALQANATFYVQKFGSLANVEHISVQGVSWLPDWLFAYNYPNNVINDGVRLAGCEGRFCSYLPLTVFPTPLYEFLACTFLFFVLLFLRDRMRFAGQLAAIYLVFNGVERFLVEKIRINNTYDTLPFQPTQAEIISTLLIIAGIILYFYAPKIQPAKPKNSGELPLITPK
ncbi:MAG: diacylglyceryl transferase [Chitinophagaceae bacterium]|jgi:prolipoprotein diacylglyceryltransferase|nr:diacylglyceryl transferase [Chitinophagaceae bacterium]